MQDHIEFDNFFIDTSEAAAFEWGLNTWSHKHRWEKAEEQRANGGTALTDFLVSVGDWMNKVLSYM